MLESMYSDEELAMASQEYWPASVMASGLMVSVEMNGDIIVEGRVIVTLSVKESGDQCKVMLTLVSTDEGRVTVQLKV